MQRQDFVTDKNVKNPLFEHPNCERAIIQAAEYIRSGGFILGLSFFLWTRAAVVELIERQYGVRITEQCAGQYLEKWDMTPRKPARRAWRQDPVAVQEWLQQRFPRIKAAAKRRGAMAR